MFGPVLRGGRVTLRPPDDSDPARFVDWFADLEATRYLAVRTGMALFQEEEFFKKMGESKTDVIWTIEAEGRSIGVTGIHRIDWKDAHGITGTFIGDKTAWRKGYGSEAMALRTEYAFRWLNLHKLMSGALAENEPSRRALVKAGYREVGLQRDHTFREGRWHDHWLCEVLRADWEHARGGTDSGRA
jgi:ribosomal-protein-alanine N-acetyltransferase